MQTAVTILGVPVPVKNNYALETIVGHLSLPITTFNFIYKISAIGHMENILRLADHFWFHNIFDNKNGEKIQTSQKANAFH